MSDSTPTTSLIRVNPGDAAIVIRANGEIEGMLPAHDDNDTLDEDEPTMLAFMCLMVLGESPTSEALRKVIVSMISSECEKSEQEE